MKLSATLACAALLAVGGMVATAETASAMPAAPSAVSATSALPAASLLLDVRYGCGPGWHPNPWGRCVPNRYYGYHPWHPWHRWHRW